ncbi:MAG TPA: DbpA RNA binding domain-containing protein, partial [Gemmataceae bacterium]|nr:DbpA RNA binding domain-containing protein [Gemmataceae bacterium]
MSLLYLESLPPRTLKGAILHLLCAVGGLARDQVGRIELHGGAGVVEVPDGTETRLAKALDGTDWKGRRLRVRIGGAHTAPEQDDHFGRLARLVRLESEADAKETLERSRRLTGAEAEATVDCLAGLVIAEESLGLGGRCIVT